MASQPAPDSAVSTRGARTPRPTATTTHAAATTPKCVAVQRPSRPEWRRVSVVMRSVSVAGSLCGGHEPVASFSGVVSTIGRAIASDVRPVVLTCQAWSRTEPNSPSPADPPAAVRRRAQPRGDPARGGAAGDRRWARRAVALAPGRCGRHEQERAVRALRLQGGAAAGHGRRGERDLRRAGDRARGQRGGRRAPAAGLRRAVSRPRRGGRLPRRVLLRLRGERARRPPGPRPRRRDGVQPALARAARRAGGGGAGGRRARSRPPTRRRSPSSSTRSWSSATCSSSPAADPQRSIACAAPSTPASPRSEPRLPNPADRQKSRDSGSLGG